MSWGYLLMVPVFFCAFATLAAFHVRQHIIVVIAVVVAGILSGFMSTEFTFGIISEVPPVPIVSICDSHVLNK